MGKGRPPGGGKKNDEVDDSLGSPRHRKVLGRWVPDEACRPLVDDAPVFYPTEEEFKDTMAYIASIRSTAEAYGICRIVPPASWKPPCTLKQKDVWENIKFSTRIQYVDLLQNREPMRKKPTRKRKRQRLFNSRRRRRARTASSEVNAVSRSEENFGFKSGSDFTFADFQDFADEFKESYFDVKDRSQGDNKWVPSVEEIEGEYWRIIEQPTDEVEVYYGADLETGVLQSGFPKASSSSSTTDPTLHNYITSGWNLNNLPRLPGSLLGFEECNISGVVVPWLYIGMCFSSFCWHVEDHHLYSLNYLHWGDQKIWYGVPGSHATKLENAMKKHLPDLFEEQPDLLNQLVTQLTPSVLKSEGVPIHRVVQNAGDFVLTFPRAYHAGFNCGFNCAEAVNVAPVDWLKNGQRAVELYSSQHHKTSISHDKLLLAAVVKAIRSMCGTSDFSKELFEHYRWKGVTGINGTLTRALKARIRLEEKRIASLPATVRFQKMEGDCDLNTERECFSCLYDLHLAAARCSCSPDKFACLRHVDLICECDPSNKIVLLRDAMDGLNAFAKALEEESISAIESQALGTLEDSSDPCMKDECIDHSEDSEVGSPGCDDLSVEAMKLGTIVPVKHWCNKDAIFPKGFKSRVKFFSIRNPRIRGYYTSEVLDGGIIGPLFKVNLEGHPEERFVHIEPEECWRKVVQRLENEIESQKSLGVEGLPELQQLKDINGLKMCGFSQPIMKAIETLDPNRKCTEYWRNRQAMKLEVADIEEETKLAVESQDTSSS